MSGVVKARHPPGDVTCQSPKSRKKPKDARQASDTVPGGSPVVGSVSGSPACPPSLRASSRWTDSRRASVACQTWPLGSAWQNRCGSADSSTPITAAREQGWGFPGAAPDTTERLTWAAGSWGDDEWRRGGHDNGNGRKRTSDFSDCR